MFPYMHILAFSYLLTIFGLFFVLDVRNSLANTQHVAGPAG